MNTKTTGPTAEELREAYSKMRLDVVRALEANRIARVKNAIALVEYEQRMRRLFQLEAERPDRQRQVAIILPTVTLPMPYADDADEDTKPSKQTVYRCIKCNEPNDYQTEPFTCYTCKQRGY